MVEGKDQSGPPDMRVKVKQPKRMPIFNGTPGEIMAEGTDASGKRFVLREGPDGSGLIQEWVDK